MILPAGHGTMIRTGQKGRKENSMTKTYKGKTIKKVGSKYTAGGFFTYFDSIQDVIDAIDAAEMEDQALKEIEDYVRDVLGGYL